QFFNFNSTDRPPPPASWIKGKIVLIGSTSPLGHDQVLTPLSSGDRFGVDYMANAVNTIVSDNPIIPVDPTSQDAIVVLLGLLTTLLAVRLPLRSGALLALVLMVAWV